MSNELPGVPNSKETTCKLSLNWTLVFWRHSPKLSIVGWEFSHRIASKRIIGATTNIVGIGDFTVTFCFPQSWKFDKTPSSPFSEKSCESVSCREKNVGIYTHCCIILIMKYWLILHISMHGAIHTEHFDYKSNQLYKVKLN